jgi:hypothetical protein
MNWLFGYSTKEIERIEDDNQELHRMVTDLRFTVNEQEQIINRKKSEIMHLNNEISKMKNMLDRILFECQYLVEEKDSLKRIVTFVENIETTTGCVDEMCTKSG